MRFQTTMIALACATAFSGCATQGNYKRATANIDTNIKNLTQVTDDAAKDALRATVIGATNAVPDKQSIVCVGQRGPHSTSIALEVFPDAIEAVLKVGEKIDDTSYAGYLRQLKKYQAAINAAKQSKNKNPDGSVKPSDNIDQKAFDRCTSLFKDDNSVPQLTGIPADEEKGMTALAAIPLVDAIAKAVLGAVDKLKQGQAVKVTVDATIPPMEEAYAYLNSEPKSDFGPAVTYPPNLKEDKKNEHPALEMNRSILGKTITIRRWFAAKRASVLFDKLGECRKEKKLNCLSEASTRRDIDDFVEAVYTFRVLAAIDVPDVLEKLDASIKTAKNSTKPTAADALDALVEIADALGGITDAYGKYESAKTGQ